MKDAKSVWLLIVSFLLFVVSFTLLWTWGYRVYIKTPSSEATVPVPAKPLLIPTNNTRDSLQTLYTATVNKFDTRLDSTWDHADSLKTALDQKMAEFYRLKNEIAALLNNHSTDANLNMAAQKIGELQQRVNELISHNRNVENENQKLAALLEQLTGKRKLTDNGSIQRVSFTTKTAVENTLASDYAIAELSLLAIGNENETETNRAALTDKLVGSIVVRNNRHQFDNSDLMIVLLQPDGQVIKNSVWESGVFNTEEGKKIYSYKMHVDNGSTEMPKLLFSINADRYQKGNYTMQVYHHGVLLGKLVKTLS
jgi:regulator of replication initiation timing